MSISVEVGGGVGMLIDDLVLVCSTVVSYSMSIICKSVANSSGSEELESDVDDTVSDVDYTISVDVGGGGGHCVGRGTARVRAPCRPDRYGGS